MMKSNLLFLIILILIIIWIICVWLKPDEYFNKMEKTCSFDADCPGDSICYDGFCEPSRSGMHHCLNIPVTGKIIVTPDDNCTIMYGPFYSSNFCATWNYSHLRSGGYVMTWGPSVMQYGTNGSFGDSIIFEKQFAIISQKDYLNDGHRFLKSRGAIMPCDDNQSIIDGYHQTPATTPFKIFPISLWQRVYNFDAYFDGNINAIHIKYQDLFINLDPNSIDYPDLAVDQYIISVQIPTPNFTVFRGTFIYASLINNEVDIPLQPEELSYISNPSGSNYWFSVEIYGFRNCNLGLGAAGSGTAVF